MSKPTEDIGEPWEWTTRYKARRAALTLRASLAAAESKLADANKAAFDMMNRHRDVVLSLEAKLADYEGTDGRCPAGHNKRFTYDLSDLGGKVGCVACERDDLAAKLADAEAKLEQERKGLSVAEQVSRLMVGVRFTDTEAHMLAREIALRRHAARRAARDGQEETR